MRSDAEGHPRPGRRAASLGVLALVALLTGAPGGAVAASTSPSAEAPSSPATEAYPPFGLAETSGLAVSVLHPGVVWVNEDSGEPILRAFDSTGTEVGSVLFEASDVFGGDNRDTEALAIGPGPRLWSADIGDNDAVRTTVLVHTTPEPADLTDSAVTATSYRFTYPDGPRDAEAFLVDPVDGRAYIASKVLLGGAGWYAAPTVLEPGATHELIRVQDLPDLLTDGSFSPDGSVVALRTTNLLGGASTALLYEAVRDGAEPVELRRIGGVDLPAEAQGESLAFSGDGRDLLVGSEGADEPIWSVPIPADLLAGSGATSEPPATSSASDPPASTSASGASPTDALAGGCGWRDPGACASSSNAILGTLVVLLVALLATMVAMRRRL